MIDPTRDPSHLAEQAQLLDRQGYAATVTAQAHLTLAALCDLAGDQFHARENLRTSNRCLNEAEDILEQRDDIAHQLDEHWRWYLAGRCEAERGRDITSIQDIAAQQLHANDVSRLLVTATVAAAGQLAAAPL